jgi:hypothetical protein
MQRLGSQASSSSLSSSQWLSVPNLDGPQSQPQLKPLPQLPTTKAVSTSQRRWNAPDVVAGRVADRIRAINSLQQLPSIVPKKPVEPLLPPNQPSISSPEHEYRRASPFPRRDSAQSPIRPETPLSQSHPLASPLVHCPMPKRYQPQLSTNIEKVAMPNDEQLMCYRHGRKLKLRKSVPAGMDKAFSGAYIPNGPFIRQQVDPLSPWSVGRRLAKTSGTFVLTALLNNVSWSVNLSRVLGLPKPGLVSGSNLQAAPSSPSPGHLLILINHPTSLLEQLPIIKQSKYLEPLYLTYLRTSLVASWQLISAT